MIDRQLVIQLHQARTRLANTSEEIRTLEQAALAKVKEENPDLYTAKELTATCLTNAESALRTAIEAEYKAAEDKKIKTFVFGLGVKVSRGPSYEPDKALAWCKENARIYVVPESLDVKNFEKFCKDAGDKLPDFVTFEDKVTPTIPTDLAPHLEQ